MRILFIEGSIFVQRGQPNSDVVAAGILVLFSVAVVVGVGAGVEVFTKA